MDELGKIFLVHITGMVVHKKREVKNCCGIEKESVGGDCKDYFVKNLLKLFCHILNAISKIFIFWYFKSDITQGV